MGLKRPKEDPKIIIPALTTGSKNYYRVWDSIRQHEPYFGAVLTHYYPPKPTKTHYSCGSPQRDHGSWEGVEHWTMLRGYLYDMRVS